MRTLKRMFRFGLLLGAVFAILNLPSTAQAQCAADPDGTPIGVVDNPSARGPSLGGVLVVEFLNSDGFESHGARVSVRLRRGNVLQAFFVRVPDSVVFSIETPQETQEILLAALRDAVLGGFFPDECGQAGDQCPGVDAVLKKIEEFVVFDDGVTSQFLIADVVVAATESL
jgi:hypothetical protein